MPTETERRVDLVLAVICDLQNDGLLPKDARIKPQGLAYVSDVIGLPVSESTFRRIEKRSLHRARLALQALRSTSAERVDCGSGIDYGICPKCRRGHGHVIPLQSES